MDNNKLTLKEKIAKLEDFCEKQWEDCFGDNASKDGSECINFISEYGMCIVNPFVDDSARFDVDPIEEYGEDSIALFVGSYEEKYGEII